MEQPPSAAGLSERPTLPWRPAPPKVAPPTDSTPPRRAGALFGPLMALMGAVALGVVVATALAPRIAGFAAEVAPVTIGVAPVASDSAAGLATVAPVPVAPPRALAAAGPAVARATSPTEPSVAAAIVQPAPPPLDVPAQIAAATPGRDDTTAPRDREVGLHRVASRARMMDAPRMREQRVREQPGSTEPRATTELTRADIRSVIVPQHARMRQCYTTAIRRSGTARDAHSRISVVIDPEGYVNAVRVDGDDFGGLGECLRRSAIRWRFPRSRSGGEVPVPLSFTAVE